MPGVSRIAAFALMALIWGLTWLPMKVASEAIPPILLAAVRFLLAAACFYLVTIVQGLPIRAAPFGRIVAASLLVNTGCHGLLFWGVARAPTGLSAIVNLSALFQLAM